MRWSPLQVEDADHGPPDAIGVWVREYTPEDNQFEYWMTRQAYHAGLFMWNNRVCPARSRCSSSGRMARTYA